MNYISRTVLIFIYCFLSFKSIAQFCTGSLGSPVVNITFGSGINPGPTLPVAVPGASTTYTYSPNTASDGFYTITNAVPANSAWFTGATDHTGNPNGYMAFYNADPTPGGEFYRQIVTNLCGNTTYEFATWIANVLNVNVLPNGISPNITFKILDANSGVVLASSNTGDIPNTSTMIWRQYSLLFTTPLGVNSVVLVLSNNNVGGSALPGNDLVMDDITFRPCGPTTKASFSSTGPLDSIAITSCSNVNVFGSIIGSFNSPNYQWQMSSDGGNSFSNIGGAVALNSVISGLPNGLFQLRMISSEAGNINSANCSFISNTIKLLISGCTVPVNNTCNNWLRIPNSQSYVTIGDMDVPGTQITVEGLFSRDSAFTPEGFTSLNVVSKHWTPADNNYLLRVDRAQITTTNGAFATPDICETVNKRVYHAAMTYDGATLKFYRNGFLMSQTPCTGTMIQNNYPTTIAATANSPTSNTQLIGYLNEIRIWNVVKTQAQLQAAMNGPLANPTTQSGLLGYYTFDGLTNKQGNSLYNATLHGAASINESVPNCSLLIDSCRINSNTTINDSIINTYTPVTAFNACNNSISVEDASTFNVGDTVLLIQMKGANIDNVNSDLFGNIQNYNNAGNYEFNYISRKNGNQLELKNVLLHAYDIPTGKVQLIRVPYFNNPTFTNTITCLPWDGKKGGIVVLQSANNITLNAPINVSEKGFRGGKYGNGFACNSAQWAAPAGFNGSKGESIADEIIGFEAGGGKQANGGGGSFAGNTGGGGGANGGSGGKGGREFDGCSSLQQSIGGQSLNYALANKVFMGGGGGGGAQDNGNLILDGGKGGGIVIINTPTLTTNSQPIISNGEKINIVIQDEGGTGGGAGGSVLLFCNNYVGTVNVETNGGDGSSNNNVLFANNCHGPGGGGGGGFLGVSSATIPASITYTSIGGKPGLVLNPSSPCFNTSYFAEPGVNGITASNLVVPLSTTPFIKTIDSLAIKDSIFNCSSVQFSGSNFPNNASILQWNWQFGDNSIGVGQNISHTYSTPDTYIIKLVVNDINGCIDSVQKQITIGSKKFDFTIEQDICNPLIVKYIASDTASNFKWNTGDNAIFVQGSFINHTYADTGVYLVSLTSPTGCIDTLKKSVPISVKKANIILTPDTTICNGKQILLQSNIDSSFRFCWSPSTYLNSVNLANPTSTPNSTIKYFLRGIQRVSTNLVVNGNFTNGNVNFNSDYPLSPTNPAIAAVGQYLIANSTTGASPTASNCTDHTSGTGNMLIVKSDGIKQSKSWRQKLSIQRNTNYLFSVWIQGVEVNTKAALAFNINGITFNDSIINATATCNWQRKSIIWNSGNSDTALIAIENNTTPVNTLYALDDIEFYNYAVSQDSVTIKIDTPLIKSIVDTSICRGSQIVLTTTGSVKYTWSPKIGLSDSTVANPIASPSDSTTYIVEGTNIFGCTALDTVTIKLKPSPVIVKSNDTSICTASSIQLLVSGANKYKWSPSITLNVDSIANPIATPLRSTTYYITSIDSNYTCVAIDSIKIDVKSIARFSAAPADTVCVKSPLQLQAFGGNVYTWSPANLVNNPSLSNPIATPNANTDFFVIVKDSVCKDSSILKVTATTKPLPRLLISKSNDIDCFYFNAKLAVSGASTYTWFAAEPPLYLTDSTINTSTAFPAITKKYFITGKDSITTCSNTDSIVVFVYSSNNPEFWAPNSFSPNKDGLNECFRVFPKSRILYFELSIYNRWGQLVFKTENINGCWDGTFKGQPQDPGNFVYVIKARNECKEDFYKGNLLLIR